MKNESGKSAKLWQALLVFGLVIGIMAVAIIIYETDPHIPMFLGVVIVSVAALLMGYKWAEIEKFMMEGITQALQSIIILTIIGILIGVWIVAGVVPSMISYGLGIISPAIFLPTALIISSITSLATGTSWGTAGTMGIALMGIAAGLGIPAPITAGAVISGAYFGDKMSPLSDTTNLAPAMAGTDVFTHVKFMALPTISTYAISLVFFFVSGRQYASGTTDLIAIKEIQAGIASAFTVSPLLLLPPIIVIVAIALKVPAIPGIVLGIISAALLGPIFQGASLGDLMSAGMSGYVSETGIVAIDKLLSSGGLENMMYSVSLTIIAMMFGGIAEKTGMLNVLLSVILKRVKSAVGLVSATIAAALFSNVTMPEQYISIVIPGRMFRQAYTDKNLHPKTLSNALESSGTVLSALIPWNTCGVFMATALGVSTFEYAPYAIFNYMMPVMVILLAFLGPTLSYMTVEQRAQLEETGTV